MIVVLSRFDLDILRDMIDDVVKQVHAVTKLLKNYAVAQI